MLLGGTRAEIVVSRTGETCHIRLAREKIAHDRFVYVAAAVREGEEAAEFVKITTEDPRRLELLASSVLEIWKRLPARADRPDTGPTTITLRRVA